MIVSVNQGWRMALEAGGTQEQCQAALVGHFLNFRNLDDWPKFSPWYSGPAERELIGNPQVIFDMACDTLERLVKREALDVLNGKKTEEESDRELASWFPELDAALLKELRTYCEADYAGSLG